MRSLPGRHMVGSGRRRGRCGGSRARVSARVVGQAWLTRAGACRNTSTLGSKNESFVPMAPQRREKMPDLRLTFHPQPSRASSRLVLRSRRSCGGQRVQHRRHRPKRRGRRRRRRRPGGQGRRRDSGLPGGHAVHRAEPMELGILWTDWPETPITDTWQVLDEIEERTNVRLVPTNIPFSDATEKRSLLISAGDAPPLIPLIYTGEADSSPPRAAVLPLSDYAQYMPNFTKYRRGVGSRRHDREPAPGGRQVLHDSRVCRRSPSRSSPWSSARTSSTRSAPCPGDLGRAA